MRVSTAASTARKAPEPPSGTGWAPAGATRASRQHVDAPSGACAVVAALLVTPRCVQRDCMRRPVREAAVVRAACAAHTGRHRPQSRVPGRRGPGPGAACAALARRMQTTQVTAPSG